MIDKEVELVENTLELFVDIPTLQQMLTFVYDKNGKPDALEGKHDDMLISDMIANSIRLQQSTVFNVPEVNYLDLTILPSDYQEDYRKAKKAGQLDLLMRHWEEVGILREMRHHYEERRKREQALRKNDEK